MIQTIINAFSHELGRTPISAYRTVIEIKDTISVDSGLKNLELYVSFSTKKNVDYIDPIEGKGHGKSVAESVTISCNLDNSSELMSRIVDCINERLK